MSAEQTKFDWKASESAPEYYAMKIISGNLRYHGDPNGAGLYVPSGGVISHGWGLMDSSHNVGPNLKPLPDRLDISFFSYLEDQFYQGTFDLPYDKILALFREEEAKPKMKDMDGHDIPNDFIIIVGVAPGGTVAVWVRASGTKEVFFGKAKKVEMNFPEAFRVPIANRAERTEYVKDTIHDEVPPNVLATIRKNGIPFNKWADYRKTYTWTPTFSVNNPPGKIGFSFYTGEGESFQFPFEKSFGASAKPLPKKARFSYPVPSKTDSDYYIVYFDETEIQAAFNHLSAQQLPLQLEIHPNYPKDRTQVRLHNGKESVVLKKFVLKDK